jgi:hypothetical protein
MRSMPICLRRNESSTDCGRSHPPSTQSVQESLAKSGRWAGQASRTARPPPAGTASCFPGFPRTRPSVDWSAGRGTRAGDSRGHVDLHNLEPASRQRRVASPYRMTRPFRSAAASSRGTVETPSKAMGLGPRAPSRPYRERWERRLARGPPWRPCGRRARSGWRSRRPALRQMP